MANGRDDAKLKADARFKKKETADREAEKVWAEQAEAGRAFDEKRARLRTLRLAKEAAEKTAAPPAKPKPSGKKRPKPR
jgi:hypothetical protein